MSSRVLDRATYEDLLKAPENMIAELIDGELYTWPRPSGPHTNASSVLGMIIGSAYQLANNGPGGWWILDEPELHLSEHVLVPDLAGWRRERMPEVPQSHIFSIPPDWVCEVLSHSTEKVDRVRKLPIYARHGAGYAWLVDVEQQYLEVKRLENGYWSGRAAFVAGETVRAEPFAEIEIDMTHVWGPPPA